MHGLNARARGLLVVTISLVAVLSSATSAGATPTAGFSYLPAEPVEAEPVTFHFTGTCDVQPCRIVWRWFEAGGSSLGTTMGEGQEIDHTFAAAGTYSVVVRITSPTSTHSFATATQVVTVRDTVATPEPTPVHPPAAPTAVAATTSGRAVTVTWLRPGSDGGAPTQRYEVFARSQERVPATLVCSTAGLTCEVAAGSSGPLRDGVAYTFTVRAFNAAGGGSESAPSSPVTPDLSGPVVTVGGPSWQTVLTGASTVAWAGRDPSDVASYEVEQRLARAGGALGAWTSSDQDGSSVRLDLSAGSTACVRVRGVDTWGHVGAYSAPVCRTAPVDDRTLVVRGPADRRIASHFYLRTMTRVATPRSDLVLGAVRASAAQLVATTCRRCGSVSVFYGSELVDVVSLRSQTTTHRQVFSLPSPSGTRSITLRPTSRRPVQVDGLSLRAR